MKNKKMILLAIFTAIILIASVFTTFENRVIANSNSNKLAQAIKSIESETIKFNEIIPFEWDTVYTFSPYMPDSEIEKIIGFKSNRITETVSENMVQLLFVKDLKVVSSICAYSENLGYSITFNTKWEDWNYYSYAKIDFTDNMIFSVDRNDDGIVKLFGIK